MSLSKEEQKLFKLTQCNTILNRDMLDKREVYLKNVATDYKNIYGVKGTKFYNKMKNYFNKSIPKKKKRVQFTNVVEYSRN
jgi:hypothetical protein